MTFTSSIKNRISWELYRAGVRARLRQWDFSEWRSRSRPLVIDTLYEKLYPYPLAGDPMTMSPGVRATADMPNIPRREFVRRLRQPVILENEFGYAIAAPGRLVEDSLPGSYWVRNSAHLNIFSGIPSFNAYRRRMSHGGRTRYEPRLISLRYPFESNYYHAHIDVMSRLHLLDQAGVDSSIPIVIGAKLAKRPFFQDMILKGDLPKRNWLVQDGEDLATDELIYAQTWEGVPGHIEHLLELMEIPAADSRMSRRVFLTRDKKYGRYLTNMDEIQPILDEYGFETVDTDGWSLDEQIQMFQGIGFLAALHGAGLTNIVYRHGAPLRLLEIYTPNGTPLCFYLLAKLLGFKHEYLIGSDPRNNSLQTPFRLDPELLRDRLNRSLTASVNYR